MPASKRRLVPVVLAAVVLAASWSSGAVAAIASETAAATVSVAPATWEPCYEKGEVELECDIVRVPLDYDEPNGRRISIAMVRLPATNPSQRIGSLLVNPGGPGGSGVDFVAGAGPFLFTDAVRARFDLVGFDPRGIMRSNGLQCFDDPKQWGPYFTDFAFPIGHAQTQQWIAADRYLTGACEADARRIIDHMSTANVARDMDLIRQAVGDAKLSYYGVSYGSFLGQVYANLFPNRFRALIIDGVLDPIAWTTGRAGQADIPFSTRLRSDQGAKASLREFFRLCDAQPARCDFAGDSAKRYKALTERLIDAPIVVGAPGHEETITYQDLIVFSLGTLYNWQAFPGFATFLFDLERGASPTTSGAALQRLRRAIGVDRGFPESPDYPNFIEGFPGVACSDSDNPNQYHRWTEAGANAAEVFGYFARLWTWASSICAEWPGFDEDRYVGPFDTNTARPVLVVGTFYDPATRYQGARIAHDLLPNSALLSVRGWAHSSLFLSACADQRIAAYLITGATPSEGTVCQQDIVPFSAPPGQSGSTAGAEARRLARGSLIPEVIARSMR